LCYSIRRSVSRRWVMRGSSPSTTAVVTMIPYVSISCIPNSKHYHNQRFMYHVIDVEATRAASYNFCLGIGDLRHLLPHGKPRLIPHQHHRSLPRRVSSSLLPSTMSTTTTSFQSAEAKPDKDGLIHGVSAQELQILGEQCAEAKGKAYGMLDCYVCARSFLSRSRLHMY
jgi:hypothetical protein